jgi:hypothetical protein
MALHHEKLFLNVMCHSGDVSKQDEGGAANRPVISVPGRKHSARADVFRSSPGNGHLARPIITRIKVAMGSVPLETGASDLWLNLQKRYDLHQAQQELGEKIKKIPAWEVA